MNHNEFDDLPFTGKKHEATDAQLQENWEKIENSLHQEAKVVPIFSTGKLVKIAAAAAAILLAAFFTWQIWLKPQGEWKTYTTNYGETMKVILPDESVVILNGNSTLRIPSKWKNDSARSVWLTGEAYFEVTKGSDLSMAQFIVHTNTLQVKVLGTKFNVNAYTANAVVALKEGRVEVVYNKKEETPIVMAPGDLIKLKPAEADVPPIVTQIKTEAIADWTDNAFHFSNTSLAEIADMIYNRYGYSMQFADSALLERTMDGHLKADDLDDLLLAIEITLSIKIDKQSNKSLMVSP